MANDQDHRRPLDYETARPPKGLPVRIWLPLLLFATTALLVAGMLFSRYVQEKRAAAAAQYYAQRQAAMAQAIQLYMEETRMKPTTKPTTMGD
jgi:hypothetical protein